MYYDNFGFRQPPFRNTPDTRAFFTGAKRGSILEALEYAILQGEGIIKVVGEVGSGKTMLCRMLETRLSGKVETVFIANPSLTPENIFHAIAVELPIDLKAGSDKFQVLQALQAYLLGRHAAGRPVVVLVEEAQGMPLATLEEIRLLSNLETTRSKLLQLVLFGQPELDTNLSAPAIRQLKERISYQFHLPPFTREDVEEYLVLRMRAAGYRGPSLFSPGACRRLWKLSGGLTRRVNLLADKALLSAYIDKVDRVTSRHVNQAAAESSFTTVRNWRRTTHMATLIALIGVPIAGSIGYLSANLAGTKYPEQRLSATVPAPPDQVTQGAEVDPKAGKDDTVTPVAIHPEMDIVTPVAEQSGTDTVTSVAERPEMDSVPPTADATQTDEVNQDVAKNETNNEPPGTSQPQLPPEQGSEGLVILPMQPQPTAPAEAVSSNDQEAPAAPDFSEPRKTSATSPQPATPPPGTSPGSMAHPHPLAKPPSNSQKEQKKPELPAMPTTALVADSKATIAEPHTENKKTAPVSKGEIKGIMDQRLAASDQWFKSANPKRFTLQVMRMANKLDEWLGDLAATEESLGGKFYIKPSIVNNQTHYTVFYGNYTSFADARLDIERLPKRLRQFNPFVRSIGVVTGNR